MTTLNTTAWRVARRGHRTSVVAAMLLAGSWLAGCAGPGTSPPHAHGAGPYRPVALSAVGSGFGDSRAMPTPATLVPADTSARGMAGVWADVRRRSYFLDQLPDGPAGTRIATNDAQHLTATLAATAYTMSAVPDSATGRPAWAVAFQLRSIGRAGAVGLPLPLPLAAPTATADSATYGAGQAVAVDYRNSPAGVRQTFRLAHRPVGQGVVRVQLHLATSLQVAAAADGTALTFSPAAGGGGPVLRYDGLKAWDATGRNLPARMALPGSTELALVVEDAGATYPITIDPLASTPGTTLASPSNNDSYGRSVASAGDVNGDGYADVVIGAPDATFSRGRAYVYLGSSTGLATTPVTTLTDPAATNNDNFGYSVAGAGDVNGDGYADVIVGAFRTSSSQGRTYLYLGSSTGLATTPATTLTDPAAISGDYFGGSVAGAGDVNGDGYADVVIGASGTSSSQGRAYVYLGSSTGLVTTPATTLLNPTATSLDYFGYSVAGAGDVNGDGYADIAVGANGTNSLRGSAYLYLGSGTGPATTPATTLTDPAATNNDQFGRNVAGAGDVNGDGYTDVIVGAYGTNNTQGSIYLYLGSSTGLATTPAATLTDPSATNFDYFGYSLASGGDVNGDGYADVLVGAYGSGNTQGKAYLFLGRSTGLATTPTITFSDPPGNSNDFFGYSVAGAGDVNGDGYADLLVGAYNTTSTLGAGYLYYGRTDVLLTTPSSTLSATPAISGNRLGYSVAGAGDVNGDGYADVVIGAYGTNSFQGRAYVYQGSSAGLATTPSTTLTDPPGNTLDYFGYSVAGAGDVNGDGYADVAIGALGTNGLQGAAYLYLGSSTGLATTPAVTLADPLATNGDYFGNTVASAGDVNGDGYVDVLVGAPNTNINQGRAYLYLGSSTGLATTPTSTLADPAAANNDNFGYSLASAGDVNGDGYADVVIGAYGTTSTQGAAYLYLGSITGLATTPTSTLADPATANGDRFGFSVAVAGDVNGDGYADVVIGAYGTTNFQGRAYLYLGSITGLATTPTTTLPDPGANNFDYFGYSVSSAGDVNGDGYADVVIGAYGTNSTLGRAYLYQGNSTGLVTTSASTISNPAAIGGDYFGWSVAGAGDVNGDGYADVLIGAPGTNGNQGQAYSYLGNLGVARPGNLRLYNTNLTSPISAVNHPSLQFGIGLVARTPFGRSVARLVWETAANGLSFSNSPITTSTASTGHGPWTSLPAGITTELKALVNKVGHATKVRARLEYASATLTNSAIGGTGGVGAQARYGPWVYVQNQQLGLSTNAATPLPVELTLFTAKAAGPAAVQLAWTTASETKGAGFEIERSLDGVSFLKIGTVASAGQSSTARDYAYLDARLPGDALLLYYRLRHYDQDGTSSLSPVRSVARAGTDGERPQLLAYPNPARAQMSVRLVGAAPAGASVELVDALGRVLLALPAPLPGTDATMPLTGFRAGLYLLRCGALSQRVLVE